jgi:hypothetical protein
MAGLDVGLARFLLVPNCQPSDDVQSDSDGKNDRPLKNKSDHLFRSKSTPK